MQPNSGQAQSPAQPSDLPVKVDVVQPIPVKKPNEPSAQGSDGQGSIGLIAQNVAAKSDIKKKDKKEPKKHSDNDLVIFSACLVAAILILGAVWVYKSGLGK